MACCWPRMTFARLSASNRLCSTGGSRLTEGSGTLPRTIVHSATRMPELRTPPHTVHRS